MNFQNLIKNEAMDITANRMAAQDIHFSSFRFIETIEKMTASNAGGMKYNFMYNLPNSIIPNIALVLPVLTR
ncbi:MAG: hypothetical protein JWQ27_374 [Ferruginibacter sp.]|nr:hypothetical protein [Ferruginibacter sp.]